MTKLLSFAELEMLSKNIYILDIFLIIIEFSIIRALQF